MSSSHRDLLHGGPASIRAARAHRYGGPDVVVVEEVERRPLGSTDVRVAVAAAAVNYPDLLMLSDRYQVTVPLPFTPGAEFAGTAIEVGDEVKTLTPGDTVTGIMTHGAFAEEVVIDQRRLTVVPASIDPRSAAAFAVTYTTAYHGLRTMADVSPGEWVVVLGAAGGVGVAAIDVAKAMGAKVFAAAGGAERVAFLEHRGADAAFDYSTGGLKEAIKEVTGGGADVVIDPVGGPHAEAALRAVRWGGRYVVVGFASGEIPRIPLNLVLLKGVVLTGFENRTILDHLPDRAPADRRAAFAMLADGTVRPHIHAVHPLDSVVDALSEVAERRVRGKIVIDVNGSGRWAPAGKGMQ